MALMTLRSWIVTLWLGTATEAWVSQPSSFVMAPAWSSIHGVRRPGCPPGLGHHGHCHRRATIANAWYISQKFYDELGVDRRASEDEIRRAFRQRAAACHPDRDDSEEARAQFEKVNTHLNPINNQPSLIEPDRRVLSNP